MLGVNNARRWISELSDRIGMAGWTALAVTPALLAEVDQHGAAVRDILLFGVEGAGTVAAVVLLASYAQGLLEHETDWTPTSWLGVRLMAVCQLAHAHDTRPLSNELA
ncbi:DUF6401 family natural product biosynthesis protein [Lentzea terrae]|jgi:hypothetical protein|uniref:DUF6401 family natural product biosynthesis protein n=1 Tax=Lentzea terrae TaxID=2200761 RepID=UPI000DD303FB|nr:DUF6401 family natural product biosynthesis protein [Lentzea terrae]